MTDDAITFDRVAVRRTAAFAPPGLVVDELSEGVNVVFGTNASGKTTLARAVQTLLWPSTPMLEDADLTGHFRADGHTWRVDYDRGRTTIQRDGADVDDGPDLPRPDVGERYYLGLHELLRARGRDFAGVIATESAGGYDVRAAGQRLDYSVGALRERNITREFLDARRDYKQAREDQKRLHRSSSRLQNLERRLDQARRARRKARAVELAVQFHEADRRRRRLTRQLDELPDALARIAGDEDQTLRRLVQRRQQADAELRDADRTIEECRDRLEAAPFDEEGPDDDLVARLDEYAARLDQLERDREALVRQRDNAQRRRHRVHARIAQDRDATTAPDVQAGDVDELAELADELNEVEGELRAYELLESIVDEANTDGESADQMRDAIDVLTGWLGVAATADDPVPKAAPHVALLVTLAVAVAAGLLATLHLAGLALLAVAAPAAWLTWVLYTRSPDDQDRQARKNHYRRDFERLELQGPDEWTEEDVRRRLDETVDRLADATIRRRKLELWETHVPERDQLQNQRETLDQRRDQLAERLDIDLSDAPERTAWLLSNLADWQRADDELAGLETEIETIDQQRRQVRETITELLETAGVDPVDDAASATARVETVRRQLQNFDEARDELRRARQDRGAARERRDRVDDDINDLFERLDVDDPEDVDRLCERKSEYDALRADADEARGTARDRRAKLLDHPESSDELLEADPSELHERLEQLRDRADDYQQLLEDQKELQAQIAAAKGSTDCRRKRAEYEQCRERLRRDRQSTFGRAVGDVLVDWVADQTRDSSRPEVFHGARQLFGRITRGRYRLDLEETDDGPVFRAFDNNKSKGFALDELSSGTRVQLLLAVRLAFVRHLEQGPAVPLILDETLANSDDDRARAIVRAVEQIGAEGRQILYFTAQRDEVHKFRTLGQQTDLDHNFVELGESTRPAADRREVDPETTLPKFGAPPAPEDDSHREYGRRLGVEPPLDLHRPVSDLHLWYLVEDVDRLHRLVDRGLKRWGQLDQLADHQGLEAVGLDRRTFDRIRARAEAVRAFLEASRIGRGRPVDRAALEDSGAVSETFIDRVTRFCEEVDGDARRLVEGLEDGEVKRFRSDKTRELRQYLIREGYLDEQQPLEPREIWIRTVAAVDDSAIEPDDLRALLQRATGQEFSPPMPDQSAQN